MKLNRTSKGKRILKRSKVERICKQYKPVQFPSPDEIPAYESNGCGVLYDLTERHNRLMKRLGL